MAITQHEARILGRIQRDADEAARAALADAASASGNATANERATELAACDNRGSLQHTPTTWIGNEQVNHQVGGVA